MLNESKEDEIVVEGFFYKEPCYTSKLCMTDSCICFLVFLLGFITGILANIYIF